MILLWNCKLTKICYNFYEKGKCSAVTRWNIWGQTNKGSHEKLLKMRGELVLLQGENLFYFRGRTCKGGREGEIVMGSIPTEIIEDSHVCNNLCLTQSFDSFSCLAQGKFSIILRFFNIIFHPLEKQSLETKQSMLTIPDGWEEKSLYPYNQIWKP